MIIVFSYDRPEMLARLLNELPKDTIVIDDGSDFDPEPFIDQCQFHRLEHGGKEGFWQNWNYSLQICQQSDDDFFLFLQDDVYRVDLRKIRKIHSLINTPYAFNYLHDNGMRNWTMVKDHYVNLSGYKAVRTSYVDCQYFCNREALEVLGFEQEWISPKRFERPGVSSGVGQWQSRQFFKNFVPMYRPIKSLAYHGDHESKMHPLERVKNPLISQ